jgi:hypothetical protein
MKTPDPAASLMRQRGWTTHAARRSEAHRIYGPDCPECSQPTDFGAFVLVPIENSPEWTNQLTSYRKYLWLALHSFPPGFATLHPECARLGDNEFNRATRKTAEQRQRDDWQAVVDAYDGRCFWCSQGDPDKLKVITVGSQTWSGLLGRHKVHQRNQRLIEREFPEGVRLRCIGECLA